MPLSVNRATLMAIPRSTDAEVCGGLLTPTWMIMAILPVALGLLLASAASAHQFKASIAGRYSSKTRRRGSAIVRFLKDVTVIVCRRPDI